jgi:hypothetical protein
MICKSIVMLEIVILKNVGLVERFVEVVLRWGVEFQFQNGILPEQTLSDWSVKLEGKSNDD